MSNIRVTELTARQHGKLGSLRDELCHGKIRHRNICDDISCSECYLISKFTLMTLLNKTLTNKDILLLLKDETNENERTKERI